MKVFVNVVLMLASFSLFSQYQIDGVVQGQEMNESLVGATVLLQELNLVRATDNQGTFVFKDLPEGSYTIQVSYIGFQSQVKQVTLGKNISVVFHLAPDVRMTDEVIVYATRASDKSPATFVNLSKKEISKQNFGQDLPFMLNWTPSLVTTSDAGAGVGYTGLRIRGSDATRINVTINGIPYNDSESQGVFWVDVPDIATSTQSIQVQRGVGTSSNGAGAFGATINLQTNTRNEAAYADIINSFGSFNTQRHTFGFGSGLIGDHFIFDGRASLIRSDGFIDRASSDLKSYYFSGGFYGKKAILKAIVFGGNEVTYQSWYGVPESRLNNNVQEMLNTAAIEGWTQAQTDNLLNSGSRTFNFYTYDNQVDDYSQDHYQLHFSNRINTNWTASAALHYTYGRGYYEEFKNDESFSDYGLADFDIGGTTISATDLIRRRWLDNDFYGTTFSLTFDKDRLSSVLGGAWNQYDGKHFGEIIWAEYAANATKDFRYYSSEATKTDFNMYWKNSYQLTDRLNGFLDLQVRTIGYETAGTDNDLSSFDVNTKYQFFNPKVGFTYFVDAQNDFYASLGVANREPVRDDFINARSGVTPRPEQLTNLELGWRMGKQDYTLNVNYYLMDYKDQLVLTGELNDVGAAVRTNVDRSYRTGIEVEGGYRFNHRVSWSANVTLSENKIRNFTEVLYDYGVNYDEFNEVRNDYKDSDIAFSPNLIAGSSFTLVPVKNMEVTVLSKYVGKQFLDNTSNDSRSIDSYLVNDLRLSYSFYPKGFREIGLSLLVNNLLDEKYASNGYTYGFIGGGAEARQNYFYPQAGRHFMMMASLRF